MLTRNSVYFAEDILRRATIESARDRYINLCMQYAEQRNMGSFDWPDYFFLQRSDLPPKLVTSIHQYSYMKARQSGNMVRNTFPVSPWHGTPSEKNDSDEMDKRST